MKIFRSLEEVPADFGPTIVTVGNFDGIHRGHQHVLVPAMDAVKIADRDNRRSKICRHFLQ